MKVKKLNGSGSWLAHWEKLSGQNAYMCFATACINTPSVGAQVQKYNPADQKLYVIPLCNDCNKKREQDLDIWDAATLVSANAIETIRTFAVTPRNFAQWASE